MLCFRTVRTGSHRGAAGEKGWRAGADDVCHPDTTSKCFSQGPVLVLCTWSISPFPAELNSGLQLKLSVFVTLIYIIQQLCSRWCWCSITWSPESGGFDFRHGLESSPAIEYALRESWALGAELAVANICNKVWIHFGQSFRNWVLWRPEKFCISISAVSSLPFNIIHEHSTILRISNISRSLRDLTPSHLENQSPHSLRNQTVSH